MSRQRRGLQTLQQHHDTWGGCHGGAVHGGDGNYKGNGGCAARGRGDNDSVVRGGGGRNRRPRIQLKWLLRVFTFKRHMVPKFDHLIHFKSCMIPLRNLIIIFQHSLNLLTTGAYRFQWIFN